MREVRQSVPGHESRSGNGVDIHIERIEPGDYVGRLNVGRLVSEGNGRMPDGQLWAHSVVPRLNAANLFKALAKSL